MWRASVLLAASALLAASLTAGLGAVVLRAGTEPTHTSDHEIPPSYFTAYAAAAARFDLGAEGWAYLAAIGKVETDHGRSEATGVRSGQNAHGCCAGPMQIHNGNGSGQGTWGAFGVDGDADGRTDIYDVDDAVATAARYLRSSGAPADWRRALFAYNHASWYVERVARQAAAYRLLALPAPAGTTSAGRDPGTWLAALPHFPGERCDRRIVADVSYLVTAYRLIITDCFGGPPHELEGEHPLGLAIDASPADGNWNRTAALARDFGWSPSCARSGCPGRGPFRVVLYNGYPGHGDPRFAAHPHLHLSWDHGPARPYSPAPWVRTVTPAGARSR